MLQRNPFPGIRPFTSAEDQYFFGREESVKAFLDLLLENRFVTLTGVSGVGKTSFVQSGIIPALLSDNDHEWVPITVQPESQPLVNLLKGFQRVFPKKFDDADVEAFLSDDKNLIEWIHEKGLSSHRYLIFIDQFEDVFRNDQPVKKGGKNQEASRLVRLLLQAAESEISGMYVVLSVQAEYLDACSAFRGLPEQVGRSKFLLQPMTREELSRAISEPIRKAGASAEEGFVEFLISDLSKVEDKLPLLQHALMRTWDHWVHRKSREKPISVNDYKAVGTIRTALGSHLDELFDALDNRQKVICERLFKTITAKTDDHQAFRRPATLGTIARIAQCTVEEAAEVAENFRKPGRSFLSPSGAVALNQHTTIELSHESLIRNWERLALWVAEEAESIKMYIRLSEASALYQQGRTELLKPPELQTALKWKETQQPTPAWGIQYNPAFERAMVFLKTSEEEFLWQEERKVVLQKRKRIINRSVTAVMAVLVLALALIFFGTRNREEGTEPEQTAAEEYVYTPQQNRQPAAAAGGITEDFTAEETEGFADEQESAGLEEAGITDTDGQTGERMEGPAGREATVTPLRDEPVRQSRTGERTRQETVPDNRNTQVTQSGGTARESDPVEAEPAVDRAYQERIVATAKEAALTSTRIENDPDLKGLVAYQAYQLNSRFGGKTYDSDIYQGLYAAMKELISPAYNIYPNIRSSIRAIEWLNGRGSIITAGSDGTIMILPGNYENRTTQTQLATTGYNNECLAVSPDERMIAVGTSDGGMLFLSLSSGSVLKQDIGHGNTFLFLQNIGNSGSFISAGTDNRILRWEYGSQEASTWIELDARPSALAVSPDGRQAAVATRDGKLYEVSTSAPGNPRLLNDFGQNHVRALAYGPGGQQLVAGLLNGSIRVMSGSNRRTAATLTGPGARVSDLAVSPDGRSLVAVSHDGRVYLWNTSDWSHPPVIFPDHNGFVLSACFSGNSRYFYSGSTEFPRLIVRPSGAAQMVGDFCSRVGRNLTRAEWGQYFGGEIPYEQTCPGNN